MKIRIDLRTSGVGYIEMEGLEELEEYLDVRDNAGVTDLVLWNHYKLDTFEVTVTHDGKDHRFDTTNDAIEFIKSQTPD